jgi:hypothetical protein
LIFEDITIQAGVDDYESAHGLAVFDYDNDGDQDILVSNVDDVPFFYSNQLEQGHWINIWLEGTETNRSAFGSTVEIEVDGKKYRKYHHGIQFQAQNIQPVHFGLGNAEMIEKIIVRWLSGEVNVFDSIATNQTVYITENGKLVSALEQLRQTEGRVPQSIKVIDNYPNPFNGSTRIRFLINRPGNVQLLIYNVLGQLIKKVNETFTSIGDQVFIWEGEDQNQNPAGSGIYYYRLRLNDKYSTIGKMILLK